MARALVRRLPDAPRATRSSPWARVEERGRRWLEADAFDAVVTDLILPGADGMEVLRHSKERYPGIEVVVITAPGQGGPRRARHQERRGRVPGEAGGARGAPARRAPRADDAGSAARERLAAPVRLPAGDGPAHRHHPGSRAARPGRGRRARGADAGPGRAAAACARAARPRSHGHNGMAPELVAELEPVLCSQLQGMPHAPCAGRAGRGLRHGASPSPPATADLSLGQIVLFFSRAPPENVPEAAGFLSRH